MPSEQKKYLDKEGLTKVWSKIKTNIEEIPSTEMIDFSLDTVSNVSGSYSHTTIAPNATADMKAVSLSVSNSAAFNDDITITFNNGSISLSCDNVVGNSQVVVTAAVMRSVTDAPMTSAEYDILNQAKLDKTTFNAWTPSGNGSNDQILRSNGDGTTRWDNAATSTEIGTAVTNWLDTNVPTGTTVVVDKTLTVANAAAEAKETGDQLTDLKSALNNSIHNKTAGGIAKNLFNYDLPSIPGYMLNDVTGELVPSSDYIVVQVPIPKTNVQYVLYVPNTDGTYYVSYRQVTRWCAYKEDGSFIACYGDRTGYCTPTDRTCAYFQIYMLKTLFNDTTNPPMVLINDDYESIPISNYVEPQVVTKSFETEKADIATKANNSENCTSGEIITKNLIPVFYNGASTSLNFWYEDGVYYYSDSTEGQTFSFFRVYLGKRSEIENKYIHINYTSNQNLTVGINNSQNEVWGNGSKYRQIGTLSIDNDNGAKYKISTSLLNQTDKGGAFGSSEEVWMLINLKKASDDYSKHYNVMVRVSKKADDDHVPSGIIDIIAQRKSQWFGKDWSAYGDSITEISSGDSLSAGWALYVNQIHEFGAFHGRGIGAQSFAWRTAGGSVAFINETTGVSEGQNNSYNKDNYTGSVPSGCVATRGCFCSWDRITHMYPESIKDSIDMIFIMGGTNDSNDNTELEWVANDTTDPEWAESSYYNTYGGDYNIAHLSGGIASTIMKMQAWMQQAMIIIGTPLNGQTSQVGTIAPGSIPDEYQKSRYIKEIASMFGCPCIDVFGTCGINVLNSPTYITDGTHPYNDAGKKMLGQTVAEGLLALYPRLK